MKQDELSFIPQRAQAVLNRLAKGLMLGLLLVCLGLLVAPVAGARGFGSASDSEGQGSLPSVASGFGVALVGELQDITAALGASAGTGSIEFLALDDTVTAAVVNGDLRLNLDLNEILERDIQIHLVLGDALTGGVAEVGYGAWRSGLFGLPEFSLEVPLGTLFGPGMPVVHNDLRLRALGHQGDLYDLRVRSHNGILTLVQAIP